MAAPQNKLTVPDWIAIMAFILILFGLFYGMGHI